MKNFKAGDVVQLTQKAKDTCLGAWASDISSYKVFSNPMPIVAVLLTSSCQFLYPEDHRLAGSHFHWPFEELELVTALITLPVGETINTCQCPMRVLMMTGCKCRGI